MSKNDGGPAYPLKNYTSEIGPDNCGFMAKANGGHEFWVNSGSPGMSLRDHFAGQALQKLAGEVGWRIVEKDSEELARICYLVADAMIAERDKNKDS